MQVLPVSNINTPQKAPSFGDCALKKAGDNMITHMTYIGRELCVNRKRIGSETISMLNQGKGCEFLFCGCSDASEVYDIFMAVANTFYENNIPFESLPKFKAFDLSERMINIAKTGRINISNAGMNYIKATYPKINFFINKGKLIYHEGDNIAELERVTGSEVKHSYQFHPEFLKKIEFYTGEMLQEFRKITSDICRIIFCRNVARYNPEEYQIDAAKALNDNLKKDSMVIVGKYDEHNIADKDNRIIDYLIKNPSLAPRLPFTQKLNDGNFGYDKSISYDTLVYKKIIK